MREMADHGCENRGVSPTPAQQAQAARIAAEIAALGFALPGTLADRMTRCGYANCRCHADPPRLHGPYAEWTRKIAGKTITRRLTPAELAEYQPLFDNAKKLRALLAQRFRVDRQILCHDSPAFPGRDGQAGSLSLRVAACQAPAWPSFVIRRAASAPDAKFSVGMPLRIYISTAREYDWFRSKDELFLSGMKGGEPGSPAADLPTVLVVDEIHDGDFAQAVLSVQVTRWGRGNRPRKSPALSA
jgi:hypothetical protein